MDPLLPLLFAIALSLYLSLSSSRWYSDWHLRVTAETLLPHRPERRPYAQIHVSHNRRQHSLFAIYNINRDIKNSDKHVDHTFEITKLV